MVGGANSHLESNPIPTRDAQRAHTNLVAPGPRDPKEIETTVYECLLWRCVLAVVYRRGRGSGCGYGISPLGGGCH